MIQPYMFQAKNKAECLFSPMVSRRVVKENLPYGILLSEKERIHLFCLTTNVYKQQFLQGIEILEKLSNSTP